ncbi:MAG: hypothetical protein HQ519_02425 [Planctomycetes bacterium]|nr:hypothetical protein [Planctomycetota bacterium]
MLPIFARNKGKKLATATLLCAAFMTLELSTLLDWIDEFLDEMYAEEIPNPYLFVIFLYATYSLPCTLISYGLTALLSRILGVEFPRHA